MNGVIKKKVADRGFGFIAQEGEAKEIFFHSRAVEGVTFEDLNEGDNVTFEVEQAEKGPQAIHVQRV